MNEKDKCPQQCVGLPATIPETTKNGQDESGSSHGFSLADESDPVITSDVDQKNKCSEQSVGFPTTTPKAPKIKDGSGFSDRSPLGELKFEHQTRLESENQSKAAEPKIVAPKIVEPKIAEPKPVEPPNATTCEITEPSTAGEPSQSLKPVNSAGPSKSAQSRPANSLNLGSLAHEINQISIDEKSVASPARQDVEMKDDLQITFGSSAPPALFTSPSASSSPDVDMTDVHITYEDVEMTDTDGNKLVVPQFRLATPQYTLIIPECKMDVFMWDVFGWEKVHWSEYLRTTVSLRKFPQHLYRLTSAANSSKEFHSGTHPNQQDSKGPGPEAYSPIP